MYPIQDKNTMCILYAVQCIISSHIFFYILHSKSNVTYPFLWITLYEVGSNQECTQLPGILDLLIKEKIFSPVGMIKFKN